MMRLALLVLPFFLGGCLASNLAEAIKAAGQDPATVCGSITSVYGKAQFARTNITSGNVACSQDGLTVKSDGAMVGIPITVTPQFRIESPGFSSPGVSVLAPIPGAWGPVPVPR